jgi:hypothetical protein
MRAEKLTWKLTDAQRREIARRYRAGELPLDLAREFEISHTSVRSLTRPWRRPRTRLTVAKKNT